MGPSLRLFRLLPQLQLAGGGRDRCEDGKGAHRYSAKQHPIVRPNDQDEVRRSHADGQRKHG